MSSQRQQDPSADSLSLCIAATGLPRTACLATILATLMCAAALAEDWPTYRRDMARGAVTSEKVAPPLVESWVFKARHAPEPAWGDPKPEPVEDILELRRIHFDDVFQTVAADGAVYFGSSANNKLYCLDAANGRIRWTYITGGPIRLAPTVAGGRVFFGSDDGYAYCLDAKNGSLRWKFHAAPEDRRVLGHGKMISMWPLRTGVLVDANVAYFGAGVFPAEGVFLYAVDADDGREIWRNDTCGEKPQSRVSPQGYLLASKSRLYVPMGRVSPAAFDRRDGTLIYDSPFFGKTVGGTYALLAGDDVYTGTEEMVGYGSQKRDRFASFPGRKMVVTDDAAYLASDTELTAMDRTRDAKPSVRWKVPCSCPDALILAGDLLLAGGQDRVLAADASSGKAVFAARVDGTAKGLAVADGRLLVSTSKGLIYSFAPPAAGRLGTVTEPPEKDPFAGSPTTALCRDAARTILAQSGARRGYCLVLGLETGQLALELARQSELMIYAVSPDAGKVAAARKALDAAGVYGARVCVEQWPLDGIPYSDYFANLIVSETALLGGELPGDMQEVLRLLKPLGGTAMIGQPVESASGLKRLQPADLTEWLHDINVQGSTKTLIDEGPWAKITAGPLPGAGSWTHQYANTGNTACGDDVRVKAPLGVLWFGHPGPGDMINRHSRAAGPLSLDGRLFVQGENTVMAYDAYNGLELWTRDMPGAGRTAAYYDCSNLALSREGLYVAIAQQCLKLDPASGETKATYQTPAVDGKTPRWGYVARVGKLLLGSRTAIRGHSDCVFAVDVETGQRRWIFHGKQIPHNSIAVGDGTLFLVSSDVTAEQRQAVVQQERAKLPGLPESQRKQREKELAEPDVRLVTALDVELGTVRWQKPVDLTHCGGWHAAQRKNSATLGAMYNQGVLVFFGVYLDGHYWQQFFAGEFDTRRVTALSGADGELLWSRQVGFRVRPVIIGNTLHTEPWAFDLHTGEPRTRVHPLTGQTERWQFSRSGHHCGCPCASPNCLFFRSYNLGYYDLQGDYGTVHFGSHRPGCWINFIPAGGLLLMPEASAGCMCSFPNMCSVVFKPVEKLRGWGMYSAAGPDTPVRRLAVNLGAAGDRNDSAGNLWLGYPRPFTGRLVLPLNVETTFYPGGRFTTANSVYAEFGGTDDPWLFASAARGLRKCVVPLVEEADGTAVYKVCLAFADTVNDGPGERVFDVKLQGKVVREGFDLVEAAGGRNRAVMLPFDGIKVVDDLTIELVPKAGDPQPHQLPVLQGVEIVRQRVLSLGCAAPQFELSSLAPKQSGELRLSNFRDEPFDGTLEVSAPDGFSASPRSAKIRLDRGSRTSVPLEVSVKDGVAAGDYAVEVKLVGSDGRIELRRDARIEHLGRRGRLVLPAVEDAHVTNRYGDRKQGAAKVLLVDGRASKTDVGDHSLAYLKFRLDVPGKPLSATLRIYNAGNPTGNSGRVCLVEGAWSEKEITYNARPQPGRELARIGAVVANQIVQCPLKIDLQGQGELSLVIDPLTADGIDYISREGGKPAELIVEYEP